MAVLSLTLADDYRHALQAEEHEAFYFLFSSSDGQVFGFLRALFAWDAVLELVVLRMGGRTWVHQQHTLLSDDSRPLADASGPILKLTCQEPWISWRCLFSSAMQESGGEAVLQVDLDLTFTATNVPGYYRFGSYCQVQQDGGLSGQLRTDIGVWQGELLCYRDHSWGTRSMEVASGWTIASVPDWFYVVMIEMEGERASWGRWTTPEGVFVPVRTPRIAPVKAGWQLEDVEAGGAAWHVQRLAPPLVTHLGQAGQEAIRDEPQPGDLYRDDIGPALFTSSQGKQIVGFLEQSRRLQ
jgi:hypothetical protein